MNSEFPREAEGSGARKHPAVEMGAAGPVERPARVNPTKGTTSYPFAELEVGGHFLVARTIGSVREALKRWQELHKDEKKRFETWRGADKRVIVKRTK